MNILQPKGWPRPVGYSNGISAQGRHVYVAGTIGWDERYRFQSRDLTEQIRQALINIKMILAEGDATPAHVVRMTWYIVDRENYLTKRDEIGGVYREIFGKVFPCMAMVVVSGLIEAEALVEIEVTAVVPDSIEQATDREKG